ncbi:unnamed protein product, partial [Prorocentrum cordatum]
GGGDGPALVLPLWCALLDLLRRLHRADRGRAEPATCVLHARGTPRGGHPQATRIAPDGVGADAGGAEGGSPAADYVIDRTWTRSGLHARALELSPPPALDSDGRVARLVLPRRPADLLMLRELSLDRLRVTWWPHRGPRHGINVAVFTSAVSLWRHDPSPRLPALRRARPHHLDQWLLLLSAVIDLPANVSIPSCAARWRWVDFNGTQPAFANVVRLPLRVVEADQPRLGGVAALRPLGWIHLLRHPCREIVDAMGSPSGVRNPSRGCTARSSAGAAPPPCWSWPCLRANEKAGGRSC